MLRKAKIRAQLILGTAHEHKPRESVLRVPGGLKWPGADADDDHAMRSSTRLRDSRSARVLRVGAGLLLAWLTLAGCVSVRPLELVPPDRVAQTSLVLDAGGRTVTALHGPEDRTAVGRRR